MLRRKLIIRLGLLIGLQLAAMVCAVLLMQNVLGDLSHVRDVAMSGTGQASQLAITMSAVEYELTSLRRGDTSHLDELIERVDQLREQVNALGEIYMVRTGAREEYARIREQLPKFIQHIGALATTPDPDLSLAHTEQALEASLMMRQDFVVIDVLLHDHMSREQTAAMTKFRWMLIGLTVVFLVVMNLAIMVLIRAANMVLNPVGQLVEATRRLANEDYDHHVELASRDEFDELASAYNSMADQLRTNEERRIEALRHVARTLNHELNNAMSIIELQIKRLERSTSEDDSTTEPLQQIRSTLQRMALTVGALLRIRRIVLTDYLEGLKMLDLERSTTEAETNEAPSPADTETS